MREKLFIFKRTRAINWYFYKSLPSELQKASKTILLYCRKSEEKKTKEIISSTQIRDDSLGTFILDLWIYKFLLVWRNCSGKKKTSTPTDKTNHTKETTEHPQIASSTQRIGK